MNLYAYLGVNETTLQGYINDGLIDTQHHPEFPLTIFTYGRETVHENKWDSVTTKCRGLIVHDETEEIIARPFEKFFNYGQEVTDAAAVHGYRDVPCDEPEVWEKMDGFLGIGYSYAGKNFVASKGSFNSPHAKWANAWVKNREQWLWPIGYTPVFEGICSALRIVVDYDNREGLTLLALINNETGEEYSQRTLRAWAEINKLETPQRFAMLMSDALEAANDSGTKNFEGYVLKWDRPGRTPYRLKVKYLDYLRLHRLVTGVTPKRIMEALINGWTTELDEYVEGSTPWFRKYTLKWKAALETKFGDYCDASALAFDKVKKIVMAPRHEEGKFDYFPTRKQWALEFQKYPDLASILFAMLDGKDIKPIVWKLVKPMVRNSKPLVDQHHT